ncbi:MAG: hypothetical protein OEY59_13565 [Deltaproteobacteria bacterium]|nr:hypothetical protein [Deltaproteobacteria bacterium]
MQNIKDIIGAIGWPQAALILSITFLLLFRFQIGSFLQRIRSVSRDGVSTDADLLNQKQNVPATNILQHLEIEKSPLLGEVESAIFEDLKSRGLEDNNDTTKVLVRNLAVTKINLDHEISYNTIFGSQIIILKKLNESMTTGLSEAELQKAYAVVVERYKELLSEWTLEQYLNFLKTRALISHNNGFYNISTKGQDFLVWLAKYGKSEDRPF